MDTSSYNLNELTEEVIKYYPPKSDRIFSILFVNKNAKEQSFIELDSDENFMVMLSMYEKEKEVTIYVSTDNNLFTNKMQQRYKNIFLYYDSMYSSI